MLSNYLEMTGAVKEDMCPVVLVSSQAREGTGKKLAFSNLPLPVKIYCGVPQFPSLKNKW